MHRDDQFEFLIATVEAFQLRLGALEATITEDPEASDKLEAFLRTVEKRVLLEQQNHLHPGILSQAKKPN
jgi:hypothetical protein